MSHGNDGIEQILHKNNKSPPGFPLHKAARDNVRVRNVWSDSIKTVGHSMVRSMGASAEDNKTSKPLSATQVSQCADCSSVFHTLVVFHLLELAPGITRGPLFVMHSFLAAFGLSFAPAALGTCPSRNPTAWIGTAP